MNKTAKNKVEKRLPAVTLLLLIAGVWGILLFLYALPGIDFSRWPILLGSAVLCWAIWFTFFGRRKWFYLLLGGCTAMSALLFLLFRKMLVTQAVDIWEALAGSGGSSQPVTLLALLFTVVLCFLLFVLEYLCRSHLLLYLLTTGLLLSSPLVGAEIRAEEVFLLILFQLAFWTVHTAARNGQRNPFAPADYRRVGKSGGTVFLCLILAFSLALPLAGLFTPDLSRGVVAAEGAVARSVMALTGGNNETIKGGSISRGNRYPTGAEHLTLLASRKPSETLYLRGFAGGEYLGGDWTRAEDEERLATPDTTTSTGSDDRVTSLTSLYYNMYNSMYYFMNTIDYSTSFVPEPIFLAVNHTSQNYDNFYMPYYSTRYTFPYFYNQDSLFLGRGESLWNPSSKGYAYQYFEGKDMAFDWNRVPTDLEDRRDSYKELQNEYIKKYLEQYIQVPREKLPRLTALVEDFPLTDLDEITAFIVYTLNSRATYSQTPGWSAVNQDIAEYFLFERGEGFCEHFALAATLMYRLYGIPCRYATGYAVSPSAFVEQKNGSFVATVTDESAHAWPEIFMKDYGWTPVEVTPSSDSPTAIWGLTLPGSDRRDLMDALKALEKKLEQKEEMTEGVVPAPEGEAPAPEKKPSSVLPLSFDWKENRNLLIAAVTCLGYALLLTPLLFSQRRLWGLRRRERLDCNESFGQILEVLAFGGVLSGLTGAEDDFAARLHQALPAITSAEAEKLVALANTAAFGPGTPDPKETAWIHSLYRRTAAAVYARLPRWKRFFFRYWKAYG